SSPLFSSLLRPPIPTLFPYTTLFRSLVHNQTFFQRSSLLTYLHCTHPLLIYYLPPFCILCLLLPNTKCFAIKSRVYPLFAARARSEEHTSELQSRFDLVCRLLLEQKK